MNLKKRILSISMAFTVATTALTLPICGTGTEVAQAAYASTTLSQLETPADVMTAANGQQNQVFHLVSGETDTKQFTLTEDSWVFIANEQSSDSSVQCEFYADASLKTPLNTIQTILKGNYVSCYLESGTYYVKMKGIVNISSYHYYADMFYIPVSSIIGTDNVSETKLDCAKANVSISYPKTGLSQMFTGDLPAYATDGKSNLTNSFIWENADVSASDTFEVTTNGTYTFKIVFNDTTWKDYPVMINYTVSDLPGHKTTPVITKKATPSSKGTTSYKCSVCDTVISTKPIPSPKKAALSTTSYSYNGKTQKPYVVVTDTTGIQIPASNYTVSYSNNKKVGTASATVTFKGSTYSGKITKTFTINPAKVSLKTLTAKKTSASVKWNKGNNDITGYEIQYSPYSSFYGAKTVTAKASASSITLKGLTCNQTYYVRIRGYKKVSNQKYVSGWSAGKTMRTSH